MAKRRTYNFILAVLCALTLGAGFIVPSAARYVTEEFASTEKTGELDYTVTNKFTVESQEDFFNALNQGYPYIQLGENITNPLVITTDPASLNKDLILDLNGKEIQRNSREPIVNIVSGTSLTITDSSVSGNGGLYNPVGSVLNVNGGSLFVNTGKFESGPRFEEYFSYNVAETGAENKVVESRAVNYYTQNGDGTATLTSSDRTAPVLLPRITEVDGVTETDGNLYFDEAYTASDYDIKADSYCYYTTDEGGLDDPDPATASYYYSYYVDTDYQYQGTTKSAETDILVTVYVYEDDIKTAASKVNPEERYAAVKIRSGALEVMKGSFHSYFGVMQSACVEATGGSIVVQEESEFSASVPSTTVGNINYLENFSWADGAEYSAKGGASVCISCNKPSNADSNYKPPTVTIGKGTFTADNNNLVHIEIGELSIGGGTFVKQSTAATLTDETDYAAICVLGGKLTLRDATCNVTGDNAIGIYSTVSGTDNFTVEHVNFNLTDGAEQTGVYAANGKLVLKADALTSDGLFNVAGVNSYGVRVENGGSVDATNYTFDLQGASSRGIYTNGGDLVAHGCDFVLEGSQGVGIESAGGHITVDGTATNTCNFTFQGASSRGISLLEGLPIEVKVNYGAFEFVKGNCLGIFSTEKGDQITVNNSSFQFDSEQCGGIYSNAGTIVTKDTDYLFQGDSCNGIHIGAGSITTTGDEFTFEGAGSYGINCLSGTILSTNTVITMNGAPTYDGSGNLSVTSKGIATEGGSITVQGGGITMQDATSCYGIYAYASAENTLANTLTLENASVTVGGNTTAKTNGETYASSFGVYLCDEVGSITLKNGVIITAEEIGVGVAAGKLDLEGGTVQTPNTITTQKASSVVVRGGNIHFKDGSNYKLVSASTTASAATNLYNITIPIGDEFEDVVSYANTDGLYVNGGHLYVNGSLELTHTGLQNNQNYYSYGDFSASSYAVRVRNGEVHFRTVPDVAGATAPTIKILAKQGGGVGAFDETPNDSNYADLYLGSLNGGETISVTAEGQTLGSEFYAYPAAKHTTWMMKRSVNGGHAVSVNGGHITVYSGEYETNYGNGVQATGGGNVTVHGGEFYGWMTRGSLTGGFNDSFFVDTTRSGPGAHYGLKVIGAANVNIYGGMFDGGNGGAFITGVEVTATASQYNSSTATHTHTDGEDANVYIYKGIFGDKDNPTLDGFNIYGGSNVVFGAHGEMADWTTKEYQDAIQVYAGNAALAVNPFSTNQKVAVTVQLYYGTYEVSASNKHMIYREHSNATISVYNYGERVAGANKANYVYNVKGASVSADYMDSSGTITYYEKPTA